ncbi:MAG: glycosyltransferase [Candidatus Dormibacteria bacterium]
MERAIAGLLRGLSSLPAAERPQLTALVARESSLDQARLREAQVRVVPIPGRNRVFREQVATPLLLRRWGMDFDLWHSPGFAPPPSPPAARTVVTVQDLHFLIDPGSMRPGHGLYWRRRFSPAVRAAAAVIVPSETTRTEVGRALGRTATVIPWGVDRPPAGLAPLPAGLERGRYWLFVGPVEPRKRLWLALRAWRSYRFRAREPWPLVVLGRMRRPSAEEVSGIGDPGVIPVPPLEEAAYWALLGGAGALLAPAVHEGFGFTPLEAMLAGTPVLASDIGASREFLGGVTPLLGDDPEEWSLAMLALESVPRPDPGPARAVAESFSWQRCAELHVQQYQGAAPPPRDARSSS